VKTLPAERENPRLMREMFRAVAPRYDFITRVFSYGMDGTWKRAGVEGASLPARPVVLDLAAGTGDFSRLAAAHCPGAKPVAVDLTERMLVLAGARGVRHKVCAAAEQLPFRDHCFDCVFVGYGLRNFGDLRAALREIERVTRPGGRLVSLDFFLPANRTFRALYLAYLYAQGAFWGIVLHGRQSVYTYIPRSLRCFLSIDEFSSLLRETGFPHVRARSFILGGIGLHWAAKE
jgi:demethylmenaquinone methyltransferase/2-methoxy-6-polyprenyl-1,4-benzoquinol methylase